MMLHDTTWYYMMSHMIKYREEVEPDRVHPKVRVANPRRRAHEHLRWGEEGHNRPRRGGAAPKKKRERTQDVMLL